ncbi:KUP/HAK/KT family potassium transporter [Polyangium sorediatum]|uniref:Probable potassium transport system protein Kup n=2 Tax=Polyangium sorediatum TaxID=889274 RepID=A0ABT6P4L7_9BACT|nr:KUP/HAK/KT family potassium transporter [Polyangium sorediatum]MDI1435466.1 KUP/HAK/KT family potassium transporter [Polyangium sorediatum]
MADEPSIVGAFQVHAEAAAMAAADAAADAAAATAAPGAAAPGAHPDGHAPGGHGHGHAHAPGALPGLVLAALGVVFGDIGTSPLYAVKECVTAPHGVQASPENVLGLLSLMFWSLSMVVAVKYLTFVLRADNEGEGGTMALLALVPENLRPKNKTHIGWIAALVLFGASLLYGDGVITPAISVLSAVEGLAVGASSLKPAVLPISVVILLGLFWVQKRGTAGIGRVFGPIMILWFLTLGGLGAYYVVKNPAVLAAMNPAYAVTFFLTNKWHAFVILGSVVLCVTGGEALYADMGHFGRKPITYAWYGMVMPSLALNYFGQGALLLQHPEAAANPFFSLVPKGPATYALVALATAAAVIASQAMISGAYSLTRQGVQLGFLPRVQVKHTSSETEGQIYIPEVNWALFAACMVLVLSFRESSKLASAYGLAVTGSMTITSIVFFVVVRERWHWSLAKALPLLLLFLTFDLAFLGANLLKFFDGGYVPFLIASMIFVCMAIWRKGRTLLGQEFKKRTRPLVEVLEELRTGKTAARVDGAAVFLTSSAEEAPPVLLHHVSRSKALQKVVLLVTVIPERIPRVPPEQRVEASLIADDFYRIIFRSGFMEDTNVPVLLAVAKAKLGLRIEPDETTYYLGRETLLATGNGKMDKVSETVFGFLSRNATGATNFFNLPPERVVELGMQLDL